MNIAGKRKRLGQHFLTDPQVIGDMISLINPRPSDLVVEIGAGPGALTVPLAERAGHLHAIEIDKPLADSLDERLRSNSVTVHNTDALKFPYRSVSTDHRKIRIVGNLPYSISTPLLIMLLEYSDCIHDLCLMVQKEVANRLAARCGSSQYGRLTVNVTAVMDVETVFDVPPSAFSPPPQVYSTVIYMRPSTAPMPRNETSIVFADLVRMAFSTRRKTIKNSLAGKISTDELRQCGLNENQRAQTLSVHDYLKLAKYLVKRDS